MFSTGLMNFQDLKTCFQKPYKKRWMYDSKICTLSNGQQGALDKESDSIEVYKKRPLPLTWFMTFLRTFCTNVRSQFIQVLFSCLV